MRRLSVKTRIALWVTLLTAGLTALVAGFLLLISGSATLRNARQTLTGVVRSNAALVTLNGGRLETAEGFSYYNSGVTTLLFSQGASLLAGQVPVGFTYGGPLENGALRQVGPEDARYLVLDLWVPVTWEEGVWLRGLSEVPDQGQTARGLLLVTLCALPVFMAVAALGSYLISRRAFRPLDHINATAAAISEAKDLSRRIGLPPGTDEFSTLAGTFDALFARLEQSFEAEKQFTSDASHELRTPVSIIKGACEYAEAYDETEEERRETIGMIHRQANGMARLIEQLLSMTRMEQGTEPVRLETADLAQLVRTACADMGADDLELELEHGVHVQADRALLSRLLQNLVDNARKYGGPGCRVQVSVRREDGEARLTVRDDGPGIPRDQQEKVWQRFYQTDPSRGGEGGAGLGLSIVRQIAALHGGRMTLASAPELGSAFTLHLPLA